MDRVLVVRHRWQRLAVLGQRLGYLMLGVAVVAFLAAVAFGFPPVAVGASVVGLVGSCIVLPPAIIAGYSVRAAEREDRQAGRLPATGSGPGRGDTMR